MQTHKKFLTHNAGANCFGKSHRRGFGGVFGDTHGNGSPNAGCALLDYKCHWAGLGNQRETGLWLHAHQTTEHNDAHVDVVHSGSIRELVRVGAQQNFHEMPNGRKSLERVTGVQCGLFVAVPREGQAR